MAGRRRESDRKWAEGDRGEYRDDQRMMINAYRQGTPGNGRLFPDGSKIVKIEWSPKKNPESPYFVMFRTR